MKTYCLAIRCALILPLLAFTTLHDTTAHAAVIAQDSFETYPAGAVSGANGGTGWGGAWGAPVATAIANVVDATANPLAFTPVGGLPVNGGTNALVVYSSPLTNAIATSRQLGSSLPDVFYVSYLVRLNAGASWAVANTFSVHLANSAANTASINFGIRAGTAGQFMVRSGTGTPAANAFTGGTVAVSSNYFLVARFSKIGSTGAASTTYDRCEIWVNPAGNADQTAVNGNARLQLATGTGLATLSHVIIRQAALDADDRVWFDSLTIGTNWADVVPLPPDTNAPVVTITSPADNSLYAPGIPVNLSATVTDNRAVSSVQLFTNGTFAATDNVAPYLFTLPNLPAGPHTLTVVATDTSSNVGSNSVSVTVTNVTGDVTPPFVAITTPTNGASILLGLPVAVSATVTDNVAVAYSEVYADNVLQGTDTSSPYQFSVSSLTIGAHTLAVRGVDISGNAVTNSVSITVYTNPPVGGTTVLLSDTFDGTGPTGTAAPGTYLNTGIDVPSSGTLTPSLTNNATPAGSLSVSVIYNGTNTGNQDFDGSFSFTKDGINAYNFGSSLVGQRWALTFTAKTTGTTAVDKFYVGVSDTNSCLGEVGSDIAIQMASGAATNDGQGLKVLSNGNVKKNIPNTTVALSGNTIHTYELTVDETGASPNYTLKMDGTNYLTANTPFGAFSTTNRYLVFNIFDRAVGAVNVGQLNDVKLEVLTPPSPPLTQFYNCTADPGFFSGMDLYFEDVTGLKYFVWSSANVGLSVSNWTLVGPMNDTPLGNDPGRSVYGINVTPTASPTYYLIGTTNIGPYATNVPAHKISSADFVTFNFATTNTTINANGVLALNTSPVAAADSATTPEDQAVTVNVLANDTDADPNAVLSLVSVSSGNGTASIVGTNISYTPALNYNGTNVFSYVMTDGGTLVMGAVSVVVSPVNDAPSASGDNATTPEDQAVTINVLANDSDVDAGAVLSVTGVSSTNGSVSLVGTNVLYTPALNFNGTNVFSYVITDGSLLATGSVAVAVTPVNDPPVAAADAATTPQDVAVTINVLANDSDVDGDNLTVTNVTTGSGTASIVGTNVLFTPAAGFSGTNVFSYEITDGGLQATGSVTVVVTAAPVLVPPVLAGITANPDRSITLSVSVASGQSYQVLAATNLVPPVVWNSLLTNLSASTNLTPVTDTNTAGVPMRFYRLVSP